MMKDKGPGLVEASGYIALVRERLIVVKLGGELLDDGPVLERIVRVHSSPGDELLDFFAGSGSFGEAALRNDRHVTLVDVNPDAVAVMEQRLARWRS